MRIMFLGDSLTEGFEVPGAYRWKVLQTFPQMQAVGTLSDARGLRHEGHIGYSLEAIEHNLDGWLEQSRPEAVVLLAGSNNLATDSSEYIVEHLANIVQRLKASHVKSIYVSTLPWADRFEFEAAAVNALLRRNVPLWGDGVSIVDMGCGLQPYVMFVDDCHPNRIGFEVMADSLIEAIRFGKTSCAPKWEVPARDYIQTAGVSTGAFGVPVFLASDSFGASDEFRQMLTKALPGYNFVGINERYPDFAVNQISARLSGPAGAIQKYKPIKLIVFAGLDELSTKAVPPLRIVQDLGSLSNNAQSELITLQVSVLEIPKVHGLEAMVDEANRILGERINAWVPGGSVYQPRAELVSLRLYNTMYDSRRDEVISATNSPTWAGNALVARAIVQSLGGNPELVPLFPPTPPPKLPIPVVAPPVKPPPRPPTKSPSGSGGLLALAAVGIGAAYLISKKG